MDGACAGDQRLGGHAARVDAGVLLALVVQLFVLNSAPANPYFAQTLQTWEQGRFIRFHGVVQWLGWLWPFVAVAYVMGRISKPNVN